MLAFLEFLASLGGIAILALFALTIYAMMDTYRDKS